MRRILSTAVLRHIGLLGTIPPSHASLTAGQQRVFALNFYRKSTIDGTTMDLSDMRKKYKGDEDVSGFSYLCQGKMFLHISTKSTVLTV